MPGERRATGITLIEDAWRDVRLALRLLRRSPAFTATAILTLAIGIGGNAAMFSVIHAVLLRPLDYYVDADRLVSFLRGAPGATDDRWFSIGRLHELREGAQSFTALGGYLSSPEDVTLSGLGQEPEIVQGARVSGNFLTVLGVQPALGRSFLPNEDVENGPPVAMISTSLWRRRFGGDPALAGKTASLNAVSHTIVGVLPGGFRFPFQGIDIWVTQPSQAARLEPRFRECCAPLLGFARLKPGVTLDQARSEMSLLNARYDAAHPKMPGSGPLRLASMKDELTVNVSRTLWMLVGAVGFVLLIACANVASLLLARSSIRARELALRTALGAARGRLLRQLLTESLVLAAAGGLVGLVLGRLMIIVVTATVPFDLPRGDEIRLDGTALAFTALISVVAGLLFGLLPALQIVRPNLIAVLRQSGATASVASSRRRVFGMSTWGGLVVTQIALSMVLLVGAGLMVKSLAQVASVDPGLQPQDLLTMRIPLPATRYDTADKRTAFFDDVVRRVEAIPGIRGVTVVRSLPTTPGRLGTNLQIQGQEIPAPGHVGIGLQSITPGFFRVVGVPVKRGREFAPPDNTPTAAPVVIVNESFARRFWPGYPGEDPVGKRIVVPILDADPLEVVGVVSDVHERGLTHRAEPQFYIPNILYPPNSGYLAVRTSQDSGRLAQAIRAEVLAIDPSQPVTDVRTMQAVFDASLGQQHLTTWLLGLFAGTAMLLATIGLYGVLAYSVTQRTQEIGIRRALGAQRRDIVADVVGRGLILSAVGLVCGLGAALVLTQVIAGLLFRVSPTDPVTFVGISCLFLIVAVAASYIPARRAASVDPMRVLR